MAKDAYEKLHEDLLYTDEKQCFDDAVKAFEQINFILSEIGEWRITYRLPAFNMPLSKGCNFTNGTWR